MPVNDCTLEYIKKTKTPLQIFFYLASEAWIVCRILSKVKNELKIYIIYICDFRNYITLTHVCILMEGTLWNETQKLSVTKIYSVRCNHDADFDADHYT